MDRSIKRRTLRASVPGALYWPPLQRSHTFLIGTMMNLPLELDEKLQFMLSTIGENRRDLTEWEQNFYDDQVTRYDKYGAKLHLSSKQWAVLERMYSKVTEVLPER